MITQTIDEALIAEARRLLEGKTSQQLRDEWIAPEYIHTHPAQRRNELMATHQILTDRMYSGIADAHVKAYTETAGITPEQLEARIVENDIMQRRLIMFRENPAQDLRADTTSPEFFALMQPTGELKGLMQRMDEMMGERARAMGDSELVHLMRDAAREIADNGGFGGTQGYMHVAQYRAADNELAAREADPSNILRHIKQITNRIPTGPKETRWMQQLPKVLADPASYEPNWQTEGLRLTDTAKQAIFSPGGEPISASAATDAIRMLRRVGKEGLANFEDIVSARFGSADVVVKKPVDGGWSNEKEVDKRDGHAVRLPAGYSVQSVTAVDDARASVPPEPSFRTKHGSNPDEARRQLFQELAQRGGSDPDIYR